MLREDRANKEIHRQVFVCGCLCTCTVSITHACSGALRQWLVASGCKKGNCRKCTLRCVLHPRCTRHGMRMPLLCAQLDELDQITDWDEECVRVQRQLQGALTRHVVRRLESKDTLALARHSEQIPPPLSHCSLSCCTDAALVQPTRGHARSASK